MRTIGTLVAAAAFALAVAAPANAQFQQVFQDYKDDGVIDACRYSDGQLAGVEAPPDVEQYAPDFFGALAAARERRASGACDPRPAPEPEAEPEPAAAPAAPPPAAPGPRPRPRRAVVPDPPAPRPPAREVIAETVRAPAAAPALVARRGGEAPAPVWLLGALAALAALAGAVALAGWWRGWDFERVTRPLGAAAADAGGRTADLAGEFVDWVRLGR